MSRLSVLAIAVIGCRSAAPAPERPVASPTPVPDAAVDAAPDAGVPEAVANAPAWVFRYSTPQRTETWTLRTADGAALLVVESAQGTQRYLGTASDGASLALDVSTGSARLQLSCKRAKRALSARCNDTKARPIDVLDCYHPDFQEPMPFGPAPGVEYVASTGCNGYRTIATP